MTSPIDETGNGRISFTVKELLAKLDAKMDLFAVGLEAKANIEEMRRLTERVAKLEKAAESESSVETYRLAAERQRKSDRRWLIGLAVTTCIAVVGIAANVVFTIFQ
jgi:hypothetical protein